MHVDAGVQTGNDAIEDAFLQTRLCGASALRQQTLVSAGLFLEAILLINAVPNPMRRRTGVARETLRILQEIHVLKVRIVVYGEGNGGG